jgi:hypothetical protein
MFESVQSFDTYALHAMNHWFSVSTDVFWLAVTKTITWIPLYVVLVERLYRRSSLEVFVKRLALVALGSCCGIKVQRFLSIGLSGHVLVKRWMIFAY